MVLSTDMGLCIGIFGYLNQYLPGHDHHQVACIATTHHCIFYRTRTAKPTQSYLITNTIINRFTSPHILINYLFIIPTTAGGPNCQISFSFPSIHQPGPVPVLLQSESHPPSDPIIHGWTYQSHLPFKLVTHHSHRIPPCIPIQCQRSLQPHPTAPELFAPQPLTTNQVIRIIIHPSKSFTSSSTCTSHHLDWPSQFLLQLVRS